MTYLEFLIPLVLIFAVVVGYYLNARSLGRSRPTIASSAPWHIGYDNLISKLAMLVGIVCLFWAAVWYVIALQDRQAVLATASCARPSGYHASSPCAKTDSEIAELGRNERLLNQPVPPFPSERREMDRADWEAVIDHALEHRGGIFGGPPSWENVAYSAIPPLLAFAIFAAVFFALWKRESKWTLWIALFAALGPFMTGLSDIITVVRDDTRKTAETSIPKTPIPPTPKNHTIVRKSTILTPSIVILFANGTHAAATGASKIGVNPAAAYMDVLKELVEGLRGCGGTNAFPVKLLVQGYASSANLKGESKSDSDTDNLKIANRRAAAVDDALHAEASPRADNLPGWIDIENQQWTTFQQMNSNRPFNDAAGYAAKMNSQEVLDRAALVKVTDPRNCKKQ